MENLDRNFNELFMLPGVCYADCKNEKNLNFKGRFLAS